MDDLKTGDLLLFSEIPNTCPLYLLDCLIKRCTCSKYSHSAMVVVDPPWTNLKGTYIWESSYHGTPDPQDNRIKFGVQLTPIEFYTENYPGTVSIYVRRGPTAPFDTETVKRMHTHVYMKRYDDRPKDWIAACLRRPIKRQTDVFTCSAFVSYLFTSIGILSLDTNWTITSAAELSSKRKNLIWQMQYDDDHYIGTFKGKQKNNNISIRLNNV